MATAACFFWGGGTAKESSFRHGAVAKSTSRHVEALGRHLDVGRRDEALVAVGPQDPHPAVAFVLLHDGQKLALRHRDGALARACVWRGWGGGGRTKKKKITFFKPPNLRRTAKAMFFSQDWVASHR